MEKTAAGGSVFEMRRLILRPGAIGDFIVSLPALECLRTDYTEVWARSEVLPLVQFADRVRPLAGSGLDLLGVAEPPAGLLDELAGFDSIVSWYGANRPEFRESVAALGLPFRFFDALPPQGCAIHAVDFYLAQVGGQADRLPHISCPGEARDFAVIHPFASSPRKRWPLERFRELAHHLDMPVAWYGGAGGAARGRHPLRRPLRVGLLAQNRAAVHRQRYRHRAPGGGRRDARGRAVRPHRSARVGAARPRCARGARRFHGFDLHRRRGCYHSG